MIKLIEIGEKWESGASEIETQKESFYKLLPSLDLLLSVETSEVNLVDHILPSLKWNGGKLGIRFRLEPSHYEELVEEYLKVRSNSLELIKT